MVSLIDNLVANLVSSVRIIGLALSPILPLETAKPYLKCWVFAPNHLKFLHLNFLWQILLWVPAQPLVHFKYVSRDWLSLISSPRFFDAHTLQNPNSKVSGSFFRRSITSKPDLEFISLRNNENPSGPPIKPLNFVPESTKLKILQSCIGFLLWCCSCTSSYRASAFFGGLWKPTASLTVFNLKSLFLMLKWCGWILIFRLYKALRF